MTISTVEKDHNYYVRQDQIKRIAKKIETAYENYREIKIDETEWQYIFCFREKGNFKESEILVSFCHFWEQDSRPKRVEKTSLSIENYDFILLLNEQDVLYKGFEIFLDNCRKKRMKEFEEHRKKEQEILNNLTIN